jgi:spore maturation protein CgeB
MLKVLYLPIGSQPGTEQAFRNVGVDLRIFDFTAGPAGNANVNFINHVKSFQPDLIHMQLQMTNVITDNSLIKARQIVPNAVFTNWTGDIRKNTCMEFVKKSQHMNYSLLSNVGQIEKYRQAGCKNPVYWQIGYDPVSYFPKNKKEFAHDVVFVGNNYQKSLFPDAKLRLEIASRVKKHFGARCGIFGSGHPRWMKARPVPIEQVNDVYNNSLCVLSVSNFNDVYHYFSDRLLMCIASGRPTITYRFPGIESYFAEGSDILVARNVEQVIELVNYCKSNPQKANEIGINGNRRVKCEHSFTSRIVELLTITKLIHKVL